MDIFRQFFFIPAPTLTEKTSPDQQGRVFIVTGGYAGVGYEVSQMLYGLNATVYLGGRSEQKAQSAISRIKEARPRSSGHLDFLQIDLQDLSTMKAGVAAFLEKETRLDVLVNNAGVMFTAPHSTDAQGNELQIGTNCLGPYLLYRLLERLLARTAASSPTGSVRVAWAGSLALDLLSPKPHGVVMDASGRPADCGVKGNYGASKVGNLFLAKEYARRHTPRSGVVHVCFNPGNLRTELQRHWGGFEALCTDWFVLYPSVNGGYTELYAALSPSLGVDASGAYVVPWGRIGDFRADIKDALEPSGDKPGAGTAAKFVKWCEAQTMDFA